KNTFTFPEPGDLIFVGELKEPPTKTKLVNLEEQLYYEGKTTWERPLVVSPKAKPGAKKLTVPVSILACDANSCLPLKRLTLSTELKVNDSSPAPVDPQYKAEVERLSAGGPKSPDAQQPRAKVEPTAPTPRPPSDSGPGATGSAAAGTADHQAGLKNVLAQMQPQKAEKTGLLAFMLTGVFWGAVSLVTPCVFPMIPITVSF